MFKRIADSTCFLAGGFCSQDVGSLVSELYQFLHYYDVDTIFSPRRSTPSFSGKNKTKRNKKESSLNLSVSIGTEFVSLTGLADFNTRHFLKWVENHSLSNKDDVSRLNALFIESIPQTLSGLAYSSYSDKSEFFSTYSKQLDSLLESLLIRLAYPPLKKDKIIASLIDRLDMIRRVSDKNGGVIRLFEKHGLSKLSGDLLRYSELVNLPSSLNQSILTFITTLFANFSRELCTHAFHGSLDFSLTKHVTPSNAFIQTNDTGGITPLSFASISESVDKDLEVGLAKIDTALAFWSSEDGGSRSSSSDDGITGICEHIDPFIEASSCYKTSKGKKSQFKQGFRRFVNQLFVDRTIHKSAVSKSGDASGMTIYYGISGRSVSEENWKRYIHLLQNLLAYLARVHDLNCVDVVVAPYVSGDFNSRLMHHVLDAMFNSFESEDEINELGKMMQSRWNHVLKRARLEYLSGLEEVHDKLGELKGPERLSKFIQLSLAHSGYYMAGFRSRAYTRETQKTVARLATVDDKFLDRFQDLHLTEQAGVLAQYGDALPRSAHNLLKKSQQKFVGTHIRSVFAPLSEFLKLSELAKSDETNWSNKKLVKLLNKASFPKENTTKIVSADVRRFIDDMLPGVLHSVVLKLYHDGPLEEFPPPLLEYSVPVRLQLASVIEQINESIQKFLEPTPPSSSFQAVIGTYISTRNKVACEEYLRLVEYLSHIELDFRDLSNYMVSGLTCGEPATLLRVLPRHIKASQAYRILLSEEPDYGDYYKKGDPVYNFESDIHIFPIKACDRSCEHMITVYHVIAYIFDSILRRNMFTRSPRTGRKTGTPSSDKQPPALRRRTDRRLSVRTGSGDKGIQRPVSPSDVFSDLDEEENGGGRELQVSQCLTFDE